MDFDLDTEKAWKAQIKATLPPLHTPDTPSTIDQYAEDIQAVVYNASEHHLEHKRMLGPNMPSWWTPACSEAARASQDAAGRLAPNQEQTALRGRLKMVTKKVRREWADKMVTTSNVWDVAKWQHGRKLSTIAALKKPDGTLTFDPEEMADILATRFFVQEPSDVEESQWDDPPSQEEHPFPPFQKGELLRLLTDTSPKSTPGHTGISWALLKLAWEVIAEHIVTLANACLEVGYHLRCYVYPSRAPESLTEKRRGKDT